MDDVHSVIVEAIPHYLKKGETNMTITKLSKIAINLIYEQMNKLPADPFKCYTRGVIDMVVALEPELTNYPEHKSVDEVFKERYTRIQELYTRHGYEESDRKPWTFIKKHENGASTVVINPIRVRTRTDEQFEEDMNFWEGHLK